MSTRLFSESATKRCVPSKKIWPGLYIEAAVGGGALSRLPNKVGWPRAKAADWLFVKQSPGRAQANPRTAVKRMSFLKLPFLKTGAPANAPGSTGRDT